MPIPQNDAFRQNVFLRNRTRAVENPNNWLRALAISDLDVGTPALAWRDVVWVPWLVPAGLPIRSFPTSVGIM